jgi:hypothetical protein
MLHNRSQHSVKQHSLDEFDKKNIKLEITKAQIMISWEYYTQGGRTRIVFLMYCTMSFYHLLVISHKHHKSQFNIDNIFRLHVRLFGRVLSMRLITITYVKI